MNVLSMFDGISCGRLALIRAGIQVDKYFSCEIDKYAASVTRMHFTDTVELGDVNLNRWKGIGKVDLLIGGSPCQGFSHAGKGKGFEDERSKLFYKFVEAKNMLSPKYFLLENVKMKQIDQDVISGELGVEPIMINSADFSAQNRKRLYWTNIPIDEWVDKGILLRDIIEGEVITEKSQTILATIHKENAKSMIKRNKKGLLVVDRDKSYCIDANYFKGGNLKQYFEKSRGQLVFNRCIQVGEADGIKGFDSIKRVYSIEGKAPTLSTCQGWHGEPKAHVPPLQWRKLTPLECERLQTVPDNYTKSGATVDGKLVKISNTQRYKMLGNGWTVDVIAHIMKGIKQ